MVFGAKVMYLGAMWRWGRVGDILADVLSYRSCLTREERGDCANSCHTPTKYYAAEGKGQRQILRQESITQKQRHTQRQGQQEEGTVLTHATLQQSTMQQREKDKRQILRQIFVFFITQKQRHTQTHGQREEGTVLTHVTLQQSTVQ